MALTHVERGRPGWAEFKQAAPTDAVDVVSDLTERRSGGGREASSGESGSNDAHLANS